MVAPGFAPSFPPPGGAVAAVAAAFGVGCMAGSFLNVVAHRVPRGETVVFGRSHCPACGATIRARDNVPVLGWLLLRGRCRDCGAAISARYPLVEAACGMLAAALAAAELAAVPGEPAAAVGGWTGRTALALTIVAWALLAARAHAVSAGTVAAAAATAAAAAAFVPALAPLPIVCPGAAGWTVSHGWSGNLLASAAGLVVGWSLGRAAPRPVRTAAALVGAALGWQAAVLAAAAGTVGHSIRRHPSAGIVAVAVAVAGWHPLVWAWGAACRRFAAG